MTAQSFSAVLQRPDMAGSWTYLTVPFAVEAVYGTKSRFPVKGTINGHPFQSSLMPQGNDVHILVVNQTIRDAIGAHAGDRVDVMLEPDTVKRSVEVPESFREALAGAPEANAVFESFAYSHQKEYVDWISSAKKEETKANRIAKAIVMLANKKRLK
ncbi:YdeI/OmpD-associated family protein [Paenibacillus sp. MBLB4367]|uniref:YdeI/OmpD-associated family protein n=1 Tax=Paenibacillus sp. MBLB4367 TaxID=3384767 RepID=UPI0039082FFD